MHGNHRGKGREGRGGGGKGLKIIDVVVFGNSKIINKGKKRENVRKGNKILNYNVF